MINASVDPTPTIQYVVFDPRTGRIVSTHSRFSVEENRDVEIPIEELKRTLQDASARRDVTSHDTANLDILKVESPQGVPINSATDMVDVTDRRIVQRPLLVLTAGKQQIVGDGRDSVTIEIKVVDADGNDVYNINDTIKVMTTRGRLSARGGIVTLAEGRATIVLTSAAETVSHVRVRAFSPDGACGGGNLRLEFV